MPDIDSIRVKKSDNGFLIINYTIKTKSAIGGQTYSNCEYNDKEEVFEKGDKEGFQKRIFELMGMEADSDENDSDD